MQAYWRVDTYYRWERFSTVT